MCRATKQPMRRTPQSYGPLIVRCITSHYVDSLLIAQLRAPRAAPIFSPLRPPRLSPSHAKPSTSWKHDLPTSRACQWPAVAGGAAREGRRETPVFRRAMRASLTGSRLRKQEASMRSTALPAELAPWRATSHDDVCLLPAPSHRPCGGVDFPSSGRWRGHLLPRAGEGSARQAQYFSPIGSKNACGCWQAGQRLGAVSLSWM